MLLSNKILGVESPKNHFLHQSFYGTDVHFLNFCKLDALDAAMILEWRNAPKIRKWMYQPNEISQEEHFQFLQNLPFQNQNFYWLIQEKNKYLGVINLTHFKPEESEWGFYLNPNLFGAGKSIALMYHALHFFFKTLQLKKIFGYVRQENFNALRLHDFFEIQQTGFKKIPINDENFHFEKREISNEDWSAKNISLFSLKQKLLQRKN